MNSVITSIAGFVGGLGAGLIAEWLKDLNRTVPVIGEFTCFHVLFILSGILRLVAVIAFLPFLHEPAAKPTVEALRYMSSNLYNNVFAMVTQPLRLIGVQDERKHDV